MSVCLNGYVIRSDGQDAHRCEDCDGVGCDVLALQAADREAAA